MMPGDRSHMVHTGLKDSTEDKAEDEETHQGLCSNPKMHRVPASRDIIGAGDVLDSFCVWRL